MPTKTAITAAKPARTRKPKDSNSPEILNLPADFINAVPAPVPEGDYSIINLSDIVVSDLKSQVKRRSRFKESSLREIAETAKVHGIINPISVRRMLDGKYGLIAGERRKLASEMAGLTTIPAIIRDISDQAAAEIQLIENTQRQDLHPVDEGLAYQDMMDVFKIDEKEVALRVDKSLEYVTNRLKVLTAAPKVLELFEENKLTLSHMLEIVKYPEADHEGLLHLAFNNFAHDSQSLYSVPKFIDQIAKNYLLQLSKAPFSIVATNLRPDGLACVNCPQRTGANPSLFGQDAVGKKDSCLNRSCFNLKVQANVQIHRAAIVAAKMKTDDPLKIQNNLNRAPLVSKEYWSGSIKNKPSEPVLTQYEYKVVKPGACDFARDAVYFDGDQVSQIVHICKDKKCTVHWSSSSSTTKKDDPEKASEERRIRKEELFDIRVGENVRRRVLKNAAAKFDAKNTIFEHANAEEFQIKMIERFWELQCSYSDHTAEVIQKILELDDSTLKVDKWGNGYRGQVAKLSADIRARLLFLLLHAHESQLFDGDSFRSQAKTRELAEEFELDYQMFDAEERLGQSPMKSKDTFRNYLQSVEAGDREAKIPRMHSDKYVPKD